MTKRTLLREEIVVVTNDIDNPNADRRVKRNWTNLPVIKKGTRLRIKVYDITESIREMLAEHMTEEEIGRVPEEHEVEISNDGCFAFNRLSFHINFRNDAETGDSFFNDGAEGELTKKLWESVGAVRKTSAEVIEEAIGNCATEPILVKLMDLGYISREDLEEAHAAL